jgi:hypothetical protein
LLDWYHGAVNLNVGGVMAVDDRYLVTGTMRADVVGADLRWER